MVISGHGTLSVRRCDVKQKKLSIYGEMKVFISSAKAKSLFLTGGVQYLEKKKQQKREEKCVRISYFTGK